MQKRIFLSSPTMNGTEQSYIQEAFDTNWIAPLGKNVNEFENELAGYVRSGYGAALSSGTAAIHLGLKALGVKQGDIVFCSDLTFSATCNPICYEKAVPVFIDSEEEAWNMDPKALEKAFQEYPNVKAVIVVNLYGTPAKLEEIRAICDRYQVPLLEDAAESLGATYQGKMTGTFGKVGAFSFNGNKIITSSGGGMLVSEEKWIVDKVRFWATQSREPQRHYEHKEIGYNYRMSNIVAGIGRGQLTTLDKHIEKKKWIYETYKKAFEEISEVTMNPYLEESEPNYWLSCLLIDEKSKVKPNDIIDALEKENIESRPIWKPMHLQPVFEKYTCATKNGVYKNSEKFESVGEEVFLNGICLPSDIKNTEEDMKRIIGIIKNLFLENK